MKIHFALPCFGAMITAHTAWSLLNTQVACIKLGINHKFTNVIHESLIQRARNLLVADFLDDPEATHLMFIDADIKFRAVDVAGMIDADKDLVVGAYPSKLFNFDELEQAVKDGHPDPLRYATRLVINIPEKYHGKDITIDESKCVPISEGPTGFMLIKRGVFEKIIEANPEAYYFDDGKQKGRKIWEFFDCPNRNHRLLSEDYAFCHKAAAVGVQTYCYLPAELGHVGQHVYFGDIFKIFQPHETAL